VYDKAGNPNLIANFSPNGGLAKPSWSVCPPPDVNVCTPASVKSQFLEPGRTSAGTVFQATATYKGHTYVARSKPWQGTVRATTAPRLEGVARYGAAVRPRGASWVGGWGSDFDFLSVQACRTRDGRRCVNLSAPRGYGFSRRPPVIGSWFTGWYLFAFDQRFAHDTAFAEPGYGAAAAVPPVTAGQTAASSAPLGPVIGPAPPEVTILHRAIVQAGRVLPVRIRCSVRCRIFLEVFDKRTGAQANVTLIGSALIGVPRKQLRRGPLHIVLYVDDGPLVSGRCYLR
jgi:hypothetical protein